MASTSTYSNLPLVQRATESFPLRLNNRANGVFDVGVDHHGADDDLQVVGLRGQVGPALTESAGGTSDIGRHLLNCGNVILSAVELADLALQLVELVRGLSNGIDDDVDNGAYDAHTSVISAVHPNHKTYRCQGELASTTKLYGNHHQFAER